MRRKEEQTLRKRVRRVAETEEGNKERTIWGTEEWTEVKKKHLVSF